MWLWSRAPLLRIVPAVVAGIVLPAPEWLSVPLSIAFFVLSLALFILLWALLGPAKFLKFNPLLGLLLLLAAAFAGHLRARQATHYLSHAAQMPENEIHAFAAELRSEARPAGRWHRYEAVAYRILTSGGWQSFDAGIMLYLADSGQHEAGDRLMITGNPQSLAPARNAYEFDYRKFLERRGIYYRHYARTGEIILLAPVQERGSGGLLNAARRRLKDRLAGYVQGSSQRQVANAMLFGDRSSIEPALLETWQNAGALHVMAVSGLHVGIIFLVVQAVFGFMRRHSHGKFAYYAIAVTLIWTYVAFTGLPPSAQRAAIMFSMILLAQASGRKSQVYNALGAAALLILWMDPNLIYAVGFQFSFLAVLGILVLYQPIRNLIALPDRPWGYFRDLLSLSIAAQLGTSPLAVYYFHQFPTYFFLGNLVVVPAAAAIIPLGFMLLMLPDWQIAGAAVGHLLNALIGLVNWLLGLLEQLPLSSLQDLYLAPAWVVLLYMVLAGAAWALMGKSKTGLAVALGAGCLLGVLISTHTFRTSGQQGLTFYALPRGVQVDFIQGHHFMEYRSAEAGTATGYFTSGMRRVMGLRCPAVPAGPPLVRSGPDFDLAVFAGYSVLFLHSGYSGRRDLPVVDYLVMPERGKPHPADLKRLSGSVCKIVVPGRDPRWTGRAREAGLTVHELGNEGGFRVFSGTDSSFASPHSDRPAPSSGPG
jgi:competence protein ComEC